MQTLRILPIKFLLCCLLSLYSNFALSQNVGVGTLNPLFKLDVRNGSINTDSVYRIGTKPVLSVTGTNTLFIGQHAGTNNDGDDNTFSGAFSGNLNTGGFANSFFGTGSGYNNTGGFFNSFFGAYTGFSNTNGMDNSFFGMQAGATNTTGSANTFVGRSAGSSNTSGNSNSFFGMSAGFLNSTGYSNDFFGDSTGYSNTTGFENAFFGKSAGYSNSTGNSNTAIGMKALYRNTSGNFNTALGSQTLYSNTTGQLNTAVGGFTLYQNTTGSYNSAFGASALNNNTEGYSNTAIGSGTLLYNSTGTGNTAVGAEGLFFNSSGAFNTGIGEHSLFYNTSGSYNTVSGSRALYVNTTGSQNTAIGESALYSNTQGTGNTVIGKEGMYNNTIGNYNTGLGYGVEVTPNNLTNATAIGANAQVNCSNCMVLGSIYNVNEAISNVNVGIGIAAPTNTLDVVGNAYITGNFVNTSTGGTGVVGSSLNNPGQGWGVYGEAGSVGVEGVAIVEGTGDRFGVSGYGKNGALNNYGVKGDALGGVNAYGVYGSADGGSESTWAGYFAGDVFATRIGIGTNSPNTPLAFASNTGKKISLYDSGGNSHYGFSVEVAQLQVYSDNSNAKISFGYYHDGGFTEKMYLINDANTRLTVNGKIFTSGQIEAGTDLKAGLDIISARDIISGRHISATGNICASGTIGACSDIRYKTNLSPLSNSLDNILQLHGINYDWKKEEFKEKNFSAQRQIGFSAQELETLIPEIVQTDSEGYKSVDYSRLTPVLVEAIKEQQIQIDHQQQQIYELKNLVLELAAKQ